MILFPLRDQTKLKGEHDLNSTTRGIIPILYCTRCQRSNSVDRLLSNIIIPK